MAEPERSDRAAPDRETAWVGKPFRRVDGRAKVTGATRFADDLEFPRMAFLKLVRSTVPHARIQSIDLEAARRVPGFLGALTGVDLPTPFGILPVSQDEHALCPDKVRMVGDPVAAVAGVNEDAAHEAALAVKIDYEHLTTVSSLDEALATPEPRIHDYPREGGNVHKAVSMDFGGADKALAEADLVLEDDFFYQGNNHLALEQHAAVAVPEDEGRVTLYSSTQTPHYVHRALARVLELPPSRIRVIACSNGGGFGGKSDPFNHEVVAAKMALVLGRPVKVTLTREEVFYCHRGRHPVRMSLKTGFRRDGRIVGQHLRTALDGGAYGSYGVASTYYTGALQTVTYKLPAYRFDGIRVFTNKPPCGPKRGHGTPQPRFGWEVQLDKAAERLGLDPAELRLRNLEEPDAVTANWLQLGTIGLERCIRAVVEGSGWRRREELPPGRGLGLACSSYLCGAGLPIYWNHMPQSGVQLLLDRSGGVAVFCGEAEIGQGSDSVLAALVAEVLGIELADIRLCVADTDLTPVDLGSYSSRVTLMMGNAAIQAAERARERLAEAAAAELEVPAERMVFAEGRVFDAADPGVGMTFAEACVDAEARFGTLGFVGSYTPPRAPGRYRGSGVGPSPTYSYSACVLEVEVDAATGLYRPTHVWIAHDIGRSLNPVLVLGQVEGSVYMALGEAMMEEQEFRRLPSRLSSALVHKMPSMLEYKSPTFCDMPPVTTYLIEEEDDRGPFGAKEVGQGPLLPVLPALANAIYDAVGARVDQIPIHPHMILSALDRKRQGAEPRFGPGPLPEIDFGTTLEIPTPAQGGDGKAVNDSVARRRRSLRSAAGSMTTREEALSRHAPLTTEIKES